MQFKQGDWVKITRVILTENERAPQVPDDTKKVPLQMWVKGFALSDGQVGDLITVKTITGRREAGRVEEISPTYDHSFGHFIPELLSIGLDLRQILFGGDSDER